MIRLKYSMYFSFSLFFPSLPSSFCIYRSQKKKERTPMSWLVSTHTLTHTQQQGGWHKSHEKAQTSNKQIWCLSKVWLFSFHCAIALHCCPTTSRIVKIHWLTYSCIQMHIGTGVDFESITHGVLLWLVLQMCITSGLQKAFLTKALEGIKSY